jgi:translation initiation factor IF-1
MAGKDAFIVEGVVIEARPNRTFRVELANGHRLLAFVAGRAKHRILPAWRRATRVKLQLTPYDLSVGRILVETVKPVKK